MTERLYYTDATRLHFTARVAELADGGRRVYLDRTALYPTSGGQPHDLGTLGGVSGGDVVDEEERVAHLLSAPLPAAVGDEVAGAVDAARRLKPTIPLVGADGIPLHDELTLERLLA